MLFKERSKKVDRDDIILGFYLDVNNGRQLYEIIPNLIEMISYKNTKSLNKIKDIIVVAYNNTRQWVLKGNTPAEVSGLFPLNSEFDNNLMENKDIRNDEINIS